MKSNWKIPVAVVGAGNVARTAHLPVWKKIPEVELVALCDTNRKNLESAAKQWRIPYTYTDFDALIEQQKEGTIIDICTPPSTHKQFATRALEAGHHVVLEKPIAMSMDENAEIFNCYQKKRRSCS